VRFRVGPLKNTKHSPVVQRQRRLVHIQAGDGSIPIRVTDIAKWRNQQTRDAQTVVSGTDRRLVGCRAWECECPLGYFIAGATGVQSAFIRPVCSARYRDLQLDAGGPVLIQAS
jgi:hypothetical protein